MMNFIEFGNEVLDRFQNEMPEYEISVKKIVKGNDRTLNGIMFCLSEDRPVPVIYQEDLYEQYQKGVDLDTIIESAKMQITSETIPDFNYDAPAEELREHLGVRLIDPALNPEFLKKVPSLKLKSGLALICELVFDRPEGSFHSVVTEDFMETLECSKHYMFNLAMKYTELREEIVLADMMTMLTGNNGNLLQQTEPLDEPGDMYVLSNASGVLGAVSIAFKEIRRKIHDLLQDDFFVIPSSIHEVIIVPESSGISASQIEEMVHEANATVLQKKDILSDSVFFVNSDADMVNVSASSLS